ncbi:hypothetical protein NPIL_157981 [Nephila pilipes]|uniref:Uncharacterized protein n=1 Tax=Nephila pilipes TaxID=299642 RepID=A0A8X6QHQ8_NEPPI|nr:hypothetical protein NPIL_157981 [Nephila pilipes]
MNRYVGTNSEPSPHNRLFFLAGDLLLPPESAEKWRGGAPLAPLGPEKRRHRRGEAQGLPFVSTCAPDDVRFAQRGREILVSKWGVSKPFVSNCKGGGRKEEDTFLY